MTEKRFRSQRKYVGMNDGYKQYDNCVVDENDERILTLTAREDCKDVADVLNEFADENEQLKSFKSRVFNLLQDEIREESELLDYYLKEKAPCNADRQQIIIGVLKRLQKELEE